MTSDPWRWWRQQPCIQRIETPAAKIAVLRDDLLEGGSKLRFLPFLVQDAQEAVFGGPFCGGAPHALSVWGREFNRRVTLVYAAREKLHPRQIAAQRNGANLIFVRPGYMTVVQKRARDYAAAAGAQFLPLGFDVPAAIEPFTAFVQELKNRIGSPDQVWCCAGSGMIARTYASVFTESEVIAVAVGLESRHGAQDYPSNVRMLSSGLPFGTQIKYAAPFSSDRNYDMKAWKACAEQARGNVLFINVAGDPTRP